jgi:hypothetical protein
MALFDEIKPGARLKGIDLSGVAEVVQVSQFGPDALNLVFRANGRLLVAAHSVSHQVVRRRERKMQGFKSPGSTTHSTSSAT